MIKSSKNVLDDHYLDHDRLVQMYFAPSGIE